MTDGNPASAPAPLRTLSGKWLGAAFLLLSATVGALWHSAISAHETAVLRERGRELQAIAELKIEHVSAWLGERRGDAAVQAGRLMMARALAPRAGHAGSYGPGETLAQLDRVRQAYHYKAVTLVDRAGNIRVGAGMLSDFGRAATIAAAKSAIAGGQAVVVRAYHAEADGSRHIDIDVAAPVADALQPNAPPVGALAFHLDSRMHLDPLLRRWPAPSGSGEAFLVERSGEEIFYLTSLRYDDAERLRRRHDEVPLPAAFAAQGVQGIVEGADYRGVPVLAAVGQVPGMPWFVVAKLDREEIFAPVRREARWSGTLTALLVLALGLAMLAWQRRGRSDLALAQQTAAKEALSASESRFRKLHEHAADINLLFDRGMIVRYASSSTDRFLGRPAVGEPIAAGAARVHPDDVARVEAARMAALAAPGVPQHVQHRFLLKDGGTWTVDATFTNLFDDADVGGLSYEARNITARIEAERRQRESEERYRYLFSLSPDAVFVHRDNVILFANDAAVRLFRAASVEALTGRNWHQLVEPGSWPTVEARIILLMNAETALLPQAEIDYLTDDGQVIRGEASAARIMIDGSPAILSVVRDITERRQAEAQRLEYARQQRDALVREVHHRIKNHLQGLAGLLRRQRAPQPGLAPVLDELVSQVQAISIVHGLQGRTAAGQTSLRGLVAEIAAFLGSILGVPLGLEEREKQCFQERRCTGERACRWSVVEAESVPVALIVNELLTNAVRHRRGPAPLVLDIECDHQGALLRLRNPGRLATGVDFAAAKGLGTGLDLVRSLLPPAGIAISLLNAEAGWVEARVLLTAPVLLRTTETQAPDQLDSRR